MVFIIGGATVNSLLIAIESLQFNINFEGGYVPLALREKGGGFYHGGAAANSLLKTINIL